MFQLLFLLVSYGAFFILFLMPATAQGFIFTGMAFIIGVFLIIFKKLHKVSFQNNANCFLILLSILVVIACGAFFYDRWLSSSKMQAIASIFHMNIEMMLIIVTLILSVLSVFFVYTTLQIIFKKIFTNNRESYFANSLACCVVAAIVTVVLAQIMANVTALSMGYFKFGWGVLIVSVVMVVAKCCTLPAIY